MRIPIAIACIVLLSMIMKIHQLGKKNMSVEKTIDDLNGELTAVRRENRDMESRLSRPTGKPEYELQKRKYTIVLNSSETESVYEFPHTLKNVRNVELISGIIPKSEYRVNPYNDQIGNITLTNGNYSDIIGLLMHVNQKLYDAGTGIIMAYDNVKRNVISMAPQGTVLDLDVPNTCAPVIGYAPISYTFPVGTVSDPNVITSSLQYFYNLKTSAENASLGINNLPASTYTFVSQFVPAADVVINPLWEYIYGDLRVNMKHQLYVDIDMREIQYWDGSHRLARIFIPEDKEETEYTSYGSPILRNLNKDYYDLDRLHFKLSSVVSETNKHPYDLKGLSYSLQVQITTVEPYLLGK